MCVCPRGLRASIYCQVLPREVVVVGAGPLARSALETAAGWWPGDGPFLELNVPSVEGQLEVDITR